MKYTLDDIAKELGLSKTTVSRAISGNGRISEATKRVVADFIQKVGYTPNAMARSLAKNRTFNIGIVFPRDSSVDEMPYFQNVMIGACEAAADFGYDILIIMADNDDISSLERAVQNKKVDGVIVTRCVKDSKINRYLWENKFPAVILGRPEENLLFVDNDNRGAAMRMTETMLNRGCRKIALLGGNENFFVTQSRLNGFIDGFNNCGIQHDPEFVYLNMHNAERMDSVIREIINSKIDCIACMDDVLCNSALFHLQQLNINVPKDIKLVSFYDSNLLKNHKPAITSLYFDSKQLGAQGLKLLLRNIDGEDAQSKVIYDYNIQMRDSTNG